MRATAKRYTEDFKKMIIEVYKTGKPIKEICEEYGVTYTSVERWLLAANQHEKKISQKPVVKKTIKSKAENKDAEAENTRLRKENERIKMELEILKKAIAIFSQDQEM